MQKEEKTQIINQLQEEITNCNVGILTDYRGLSNVQITELRRGLQKVGAQYKVVKNTLARLAAGKAEKQDLAESFEGPVAIAFGYEDLSAPAKVITDYIRTSGTGISIKAGFMADRLLTAGDVITLASLPPRDVLVARVVGGMKSPFWALVGCLVSPLRGFAGVLQARIKQLEGE